MSMASAGENSSKKDEATKDRKRSNVTQNDYWENTKRIRSENDGTIVPKQEKDVLLEEGKDTFSLLVSNIPYQWSYDEITDYINENCTDVYTLEQLDCGDFEKGQRIQLTFTSFEQCNNARKLLKSKTIDGKKLEVVYKIPGESESDGEMDIPLAQRRTATHSLPTRVSNIDIWEIDPNGTYGLKSSYLKSLGIKPPIDKWIHISNFRCDKNELKEVLELAGQLVICRVVCAFNKYAMAMYSHPLEAVQAVAMLNGQTFYGQVLKVSMYSCDENELFLPKGLVKVGPGFGTDGKPLRDIVKQYERYINGKTNCINETIFNISNNDTDFNGDESNDAIKEEIDIEENYDDITINDNQNNDNESNENEPGSSARLISNENNSINKQNIRRPESVPIGPSSAPTTQYSYQPAISQLENKSFRPGINQTGYNPVNLPGPVYGPQNMNGPRDPRIRFPGPYGARPQGPVPGPNGCEGPMEMPPYRDVRLPQKTSPVVELSNLPLSTTFPIISKKMALVGQVVSLQLTRVGCALVRFASTEHAERCYLHYNEMFVMGNIIQVKFV